MLGALQVALERGIGSQLQGTEPPFENRRQLERAGAFAEARLCGLVLEGEPDVDREPPCLGGAHARTQAPARVLGAQVGYLCSQEVARDLPVIGEPSGQLSREPDLS